jgi:hypothetical protein
MGDDYKDYPFDRDYDAHKAISVIKNEEKKSEGYRPKWVEKALDGRSVLSCALDVHMTTTGSYERSRFDQMQDVRVLFHVIKHWRSSLHFTYDFDESVKKLIQAALNEFALSEVVNMTR